MANRVRAGISVGFDGDGSLTDGFLDFPGEYPRRICLAIHPSFRKLSETRRLKNWDHGDVGISSFAASKGKTEEADPLFEGFSVGVLHPVKLDGDSGH